jgi:cell division protein FtsZ
MRAAELAINHPLLENSIDNARGVLIQFSAASNMKLAEINDASRLIQEIVHPGANIYFGSSINDAMGDEIRVTVIAAGFDEQPARPPVRKNSFSGPNSGAIPVVPESSVVPEVQAEAEAPASVPSWFASASAETVDIEPEVVTEQPRAFDFEPKRVSSAFDDGMDIPDFLK